MSAEGRDLTAAKLVSTIGMLLVSLRLYERVPQGERQQYIEMLIENVIAAVAQDVGQEAVAAAIEAAAARFEESAATLAHKH